MNDHPILSIIVPVYNVEPYIKKCIASLLVPNCDEYEIIVVNDGTKDNSINIIRKNFDDSRIRIIEQDNAGLSAARNRGIREACGEYIWCFDSDDWAEPDAISQIISELNGEDLIFFSSHYRNYEKDNRQSLYDLKNEASTGKELASKSYWLPTPFYILRKDFLENNNLFFTEGILHEDALFTPIMIMQCNKVKCISKPLYHYRQRVGSITSAPIKPKRIQDIIYVMGRLIDFGNTLDLDIKYKWGRCLSQLTNELLYCTKKCEDNETKERVKSFINGNYDLIAYLQHSSRRNKIMGRLAQVFGGNLYGIYSILHEIRYK